MEKSDFWGVAVNGKPIYKGDCLKWGLGQFADLRGGGGGGGRKKKGGGVGGGGRGRGCGGFSRES